MDERDCPVTDITDVHVDAYKTRAGNVRRGQYVFDAGGRRHRVASVVKAHGWVTIARDDGWPNQMREDATITVADGN